jgi:hypothetical protein
MSTLTRHRLQRIADLNAQHDPADLSHYFPSRQVEERFFHGGRPVALCGYRLDRRPDAVDAVSGSTTATGAALADEEVELCPYCHVIYTRTLGR